MRLLTALASRREVLQKEDELNEIVQLVGKDSLAEGDKARPAPPCEGAPHGIACCAPHCAAASASARLGAP